MNKVEAFYNAHVAAEWERLSQHKLEFGTTCRVLKRFLPARARVLDVGGGPGRYSFLLAEAGHTVTLYELSAASIDFAREHARTSGIALEACIQGDVRDLDRHGLGLFDVVLCMGPLYHLLEEEERTNAVGGCLNALRPGGTLVAAFISCFAPLLEAMRNKPAEIAPLKEEFLGYLENGRLVMPPEGGGFTDAFFFRPDAIGPFMARFPLQQLLLTATEGLPNQTGAAIYAQGPAVTEAALDIIERTGTDPLTWGASDHFLYAGRKL